MEAKDTIVIKSKHCNIYCHKDQAEISFKAGYEKGFNDCIKSSLDNDFDGGKRAGIKEVVDWIKKTGIKIEDSDYYPHKGEKPKIFKAVYQHNLDKKLKEWGLDNKSL